MRQPADAGVLLHRERIAVVRRAALDDVGDIDVLALHADDRQHVVEQHARLADKGLALQVLVGAGALADEQHLGVMAADAEDDVCARLTQRAFPTAFARAFQRFPRS